jgi:hypothetical protein
LGGGGLWAAAGLASTVVAPASRLFSTSSLTAVARSRMTCPLQMRCTAALSMGLISNAIFFFFLRGGRDQFAERAAAAAVAASDSIQSCERRSKLCGGSWAFGTKPSSKEAPTSF